MGKLILGIVAAATEQWRRRLLACFGDDGCRFEFKKCLNTVQQRERFAVF